MGNFAGHNIIWELDRSSLVYYGGETITGKVYITAKVMPLEIRTVFLSYAIRGCDYKSKTKLNYRWLYSTTKPLKTDRFEQPDGRLDTNTMQGQINVLLPEDVPPVIFCNKGIPLVMHTLQISSDGRLDFDMQQSSCLTLTVYPRLNIFSSPKYNRVIEATEGHKSTILHVSLDTGAVVPGQNFTLEYKITNPKMLAIQALKVELIQIYSVNITRGHRIAFTTVAPDINRSTDRLIHDRFIMSLPDLPFPPTTNYVGGVGNQCQISISYLMRCTMVVKAIMHPDIVVNLPLIVGNHPRMDSGSATVPIGFQRLITSQQGELCYYAQPHSSESVMFRNREQVHSWSSMDDVSLASSGPMFGDEPALYEHLTPAPQTATAHSSYDRKKQLHDFVNVYRTKSVLGFATSVSSKAHKVTHTLSEIIGGMRKEDDVGIEQSSFYETPKGKKKEDDNPSPEENEYSIIEDCLSGDAKAIIDGGLKWVDESHEEEGEKKHDEKISNHF